MLGKPMCKHTFDTLPTAHNRATELRSPAMHAPVNMAIQAKIAPAEATGSKWACFLEDSENEESGDDLF